MPEAHSVTTPYRSFLVLITLVLVIAALYWAQAVLIPLALALLLAFILSPAVLMLQRRGLGRLPSVFLVVILAFLLLGGIGIILATQIRGLANELPSKKPEIARKINSLLGAGQGSFWQSVQTTVQDITNEVLKNQQDASDANRNLTPGEPKPGEPLKAPLRVQVEPSRYSQLREMLEPAGQFLATAVMVVVLVIFMLIRREDLRSRLVRLTSHGRLVVTTRAIDEAAQRISRYLVMQLLINTCFGVTISVGLFLIGVPHAFLWGFLTGALRFVPYVGTWLGAALLLVYTIAISEGWTMPIVVFGLFLVAEMATANVVEPLILGHSTGISSVALLVAAAFWTWLWGPLGLVLSTPLTACLVVLGKYVPQLEFFNILLGDEPVLDAEVSYYQRLVARDQDEATELVENHLQEHSWETVYDEVLIPTLVLTKRDRARGELSEEDEAFVLQVTREVLTDVVSHQQKIHVIATKSAAAAGDERDKVLVLGCPARDVEDEVALQMFQQLLEAANCRVELLSAHTLSGEFVSIVERDHPALVCIAALPPGGRAITRYLCKRLRSHFPDLKIVVGCWGQTENQQQVRERLVAAGANGVAMTLLESRSQALPLIQAVRHLRSGTDEKLLEPAGAG